MAAAIVAELDVDGGDLSVPLDPLSCALDCLELDLENPHELRLSGRLRVELAKQRGGALPDGDSLPLGRDGVPALSLAAAVCGRSHRVPRLGVLRRPGKDFLEEREDVDSAPVWLGEDLLDDQEGGGAVADLVEPQERDPGPSSLRIGGEKGRKLRSQQAR